MKALSIQVHTMPLKQFPIGIEKFFPNLVAIRWWFGHLTTLTTENLRPFPGLRHMDVPNRIVTLNEGLFKYTPKIKYLSFFGNLLTHVGRDLLENLNELTYANFFSNPCISSHADTPQAIRAIKMQLLIQCPSQSTTIPTPITTTLATTTTKACYVRCTMNAELDQLMKSLNEQIKKSAAQSLAFEVVKKTVNEQSQTIEFLKKENAEHRQSFERLNKIFMDQNEAIARNENRTLELDKRVREILSQP